MELTPEEKQRRSAAMKLAWAKRKAGNAVDPNVTAVEPEQPKIDVATAMGVKLAKSERIANVSSKPVSRAEMRRIMPKFFSEKTVHHGTLADGRKVALSEGIPMRLLKPVGKVTTVSTSQVKQIEISGGPVDPVTKRRI